MFGVVTSEAERRIGSWDTWQQFLYLSFAIYSNDNTKRTKKPTELLLNS